MDNLKDQVAIFKKELKTRFSEEELLLLICEQMERDVLKIGLTIHFQEKSTPKKINHSILQFLKEISDEQFEQLAYIIDLPEESLFQEAYYSDDYQFIVDVILLRLLTKIYYRLKYSS